MNELWRPELLDVLRALAKLELNRDDFVVFGSGPLLAHGIRKNVSDLDVVARGTSWEWALENGDLIDDIESRSPRVLFVINGIEIEIGPKWYSVPRWNTDHLIDTADVIAGFRFAKLDYVREYKIALGRAKDLTDIAAIDASRHRSGC